MSRTNFIGFVSIEDMVKPGQRVFLLPVTEDFPGQYCGTRKTWIQVQQQDGDDVRYCRVPMGAEALMANGQVLDEKTSERVSRRTQSAVASLAIYFRSLGCEVLEAVIAMPKELTLLNGGTALIRYNATQDCFVPVQQTAEAAA